MESFTDLALHHLTRLSHEIGCRPIGSKPNHAAADYISDTFKKAGCQLEFQSFSCPDWYDEKTVLEMEGEVLDAYANTFSPPCDITAPTLALGTSPELESADLHGRIPIFYGDLAQHSIGAKGAIYISERDQKIIKLLESGRPAALITVSPFLNGRARLIEDFDLAIPSVTVLPSTGLKLVKQAGCPVHLFIHTHSSPSHSGNVIGRLVGERPEKIIICAHYDTKIDTPGAYDNAAGVAALLTLAEIFSRQLHQVSLEFIAFSGEEVYGLGDMEYLRKYQDAFDNILAGINLDGIGPRLATNTVAAFSSSQSFNNLVSGLLSRFPGMIQTDPWPASDHYILYSHGVPSLALTSTGVNDMLHSPADTVEWISPEKISEVISFVQEIVLQLEGKSLRWTRPA